MMASSSADNTPLTMGQQEEQEQEQQQQPSTSSLSPSALEDPYFVFRNDLLRKLELVDEHLAELERVNRPAVADADADAAVQIKNAARALKRSIKDASSTYKDLETCVRLAATAGPGSSISEQEIYDRKCYARASYDRLNQARQQLANITGGLNSRSSNLHTRAISNNIMNGSNGSPTTYGILQQRDVDLENGCSSSSFNGVGGGRVCNGHGNSKVNGSAAGRVMSLQRMQRQQDETLDDLDAAVVRVGHMAEHMHEEIGYQGKLLDEMENDLDQAAEEMGLVMGKLSDFLGTKDKWQLCTILILLVIAILLFLLVIYA